MIIIDGQRLDDGVDEPDYDDNLSDEEIESVGADGEEEDQRFGFCRDPECVFGSEHFYPSECVTAEMMAGYFEEANEAADVQK